MEHTEPNKEGEKIIPLFDESTSHYQGLKKIMTNEKFIVFWLVNENESESWSAMGKDLTKSEAVWGLKMLERRLNRILDGAEDV